MRRELVIAGCAVVLVAASACDASLNIGGPPTGGPTCPAPSGPMPDRLSGSLLLAAQAVPSATLVPCLRTLPAGWAFRETAVRNGQAKIVLDLGSNNQRAATVFLTGNCDVGGARARPTDQAGARRYDHVSGAAPDYSAQRYYVFPGGCVRYEFLVHGPAGAAQVRTLTRALGFVDRDVLRRFVHDRSDGRFELDPAGS